MIKIITITVCFATVLVISATVFAHERNKGPLPQFYKENINNLSILSKKAEDLHYYYFYNAAAQQIVANLLDYNDEFTQSICLGIIAHCNKAKLSEAVRLQMINSLRKLCGSRNPNLRSRAVFCIGINNYQEAKDEVIKLVDDQNAVVRSEAKNALKDMKVDIKYYFETNKQTVIEGNNKFAIDLYAELSKEKGNLFLSPFSISSALAMTYAGARGDTGTQIANTLHFNLDHSQLHSVFHELVKDLIADPNKNGYQLSIANALWGQEGYKFKDDFVSLIKSNYDVGFNIVDFINQIKREESRKIINNWVKTKTNEKIEELIKPGKLTPMTRLVLTTAVYFKGKWQNPFDTKRTRNSHFTLLNDEKIQVPLMNQVQEFKYFEDDKLQIIELPYLNNKISMCIVLPKQMDGLQKIEELLEQQKLDNWLTSLKISKVDVWIPIFKISTEFELNKTLSSLGMKDAFNQSADFSGMTPDFKGLYISDVIHQAFVDVNEEGTEAAAATDVTLRAKSIEILPPVFKANHPFMFIIRDTNTGSILFIGRVIDPRIE